MGRDRYARWRRSRSDYEHENINAFMAFVKYFNISQTDLIGLDLYDFHDFEYFPLDLIFTFNNELLQIYYLWENTPDPFIFGFTVDNISKRPLHYQMPPLFQELVGRELNVIWRHSRSDYERENENIAVGFINHFWN